MPGPSRWRGEAAFLAAATDKLLPTALDDRTRAVLQLVKDCGQSGVPDVDENAQEGTRDTPETAAALRRLAADSVVLLKNERDILPLKKDKKVSLQLRIYSPILPVRLLTIEKTLVIGPNAIFPSYCGGGSAALNPYYVVTPLQAIQDKVSAENVKFTVGAHSYAELPDLAPMLRPQRTSENAGMTFTAYNDPPTSETRHALDTMHLDSSNMMFMDFKPPGLNNIWYADISGYLVADRDGELELGICVYGSAQLFVDGELVLDITEKQVQGSSFFGCGTREETATIICKKGSVYEILLQFASATTSKLKPQGVQFGGGAVKCGGVWKIDAEQEICNAVELAKEYDQVIVCAGLNKEWESEGFDRPDMRLPAQLDDLISRVLQANPNTVVVMQSGTPVEMPWLAEAASLVHAWYGGNETGNGIADVLFGDVNPSAKLPLTFPARVQDNPAFVNFRSEAGRTLYGEDIYVGYRWYEKLADKVNFPFGHGLSYTSFQTSDLKVELEGDEILTSVQLTNMGERRGAEVLQVYISHVNPAISRPLKELKDFQKVDLQAGESRSVCFRTSKKYACSYFDERRGKWLCEKGEYRLVVSNSSELREGNHHVAAFCVEASEWWDGV
jgi:beta-glucosidase